VTAKDKNTSKEQKITIQNSTNLSDEEVEKMKKDAELHAEDDKKKKDLVEARNQANSVAFEIDKQLSEYGTKLTEADKKQIEDDVKALKDLAAKDDATKEELDSAVEQTFKSAQKIGEVMQKAASEGGTPGGATSPDGDSTSSDESASAADSADASSTNSDKKAKSKKDEGPVEEGEVVKE